MRPAMDAILQSNFRHVKANKTRSSFAAVSGSNTWTPLSIMSRDEHPPQSSRGQPVHVLKWANDTSRNSKCHIRRRSSASDTLTSSIYPNCR